MKNLLLFLLCILPFLAWAQSQMIQGTIVDQSNQEPVGFATVYLNGTTRGTTTDDEGRFSLRIDQYPAELIISHLNFEPHQSWLTKDQKEISIKLSPRNQVIQGVEVTDLDRRAQNLAEFKQLFLGTNSWGERAKIINEDDLIFSRDFGELADNQNKNALSTSGYEQALNLKVNAKAPLLIELPDLGYQIQVNLIDFISDYATRAYTYEGHFYFQPYEGPDGKPKAKHQKNRVKAYFNSHQHFFQALNEDKLDENGYEVLIKYIDPYTREKSYLQFNIWNYINRLKQGDFELFDLKGQKLSILYHANAKGYPFNVNCRKSRFPQQSDLRIENNLCRIYADGTMADKHLYFSGTMAEKGVGSLLPNDYHPPLAPKE